MMARSWWISDGESRSGRVCTRSKEVAFSRLTTDRSVGGQWPASSRPNADRGDREAIVFEEEEGRVKTWELPDRISRRLKVPFHEAEPDGNGAFKADGQVQVSVSEDIRTLQAGSNEVFLL